MMKLPGRENKVNQNLRYDKGLFIDKRRVSLTDQFIPMGEDRPDRDTVISDDDVNNLKIALNTTSTINEFLGLV